jgi:starch synthase
MPDSRVIWLLAREYEGWAEAGGVKDVVHDMSKGFIELGWEVHVVLPFYGFLQNRITAHGKKTWSGRSHHTIFSASVFESWEVAHENLFFHFMKTPSFLEKKGIYTVTKDEEQPEIKLFHGMGYPDASKMNLEFQWSIVEFWHQLQIFPALVLAHDGHCGFVSALARCDHEWKIFFKNTRFFLLIHNAGESYRQVLESNARNAELIQMPKNVLRSLTWEQTWDPVIFSTVFGRVATVSENYAQEIETGINDFYSGSFGRYIRAKRVKLTGITNGFDVTKSDPRFPHRCGLPFKFDPLTGDWEGKNLSRNALVEGLIWRVKDVFGWIKDWKRPLYVFQSRLTAQKGVDDLIQLVENALNSSYEVNFLIMGVGEKKYEQSLMWLARHRQDSGHLLFVNTYNEDLARLVFASADFFLMPSLYEPCGLTDLKAQMMGALPIVARVGGLVKIVDGVTGFSYDKNVDQGLWGAFERTCVLNSERPDILEIMRRQAFRSCLANYRWTDILEKKYLPWFDDIP